MAIVSPSWGGPSVFPHIYENGLKVLQEWGLEIKEFPTAKMDAAFTRANPQVRAKDAIAFAKGKEIVLIDGNQLEAMLEDTLDTLPVKSADEKTGICPRCGNELVRRKGRRGEFIGCSSFPKCRYTANLA